jgi:hypothetical protein
LLLSLPSPSSCSDEVLQLRKSASVQLLSLRLFDPLRANRHLVPAPAASF